MVVFVRPAAAKKKRCRAYRRYGFWGAWFGGVQCVVLKVGVVYPP